MNNRKPSAEINGSGWKIPTILGTVVSIIAIIGAVITVYRFIDNLSDEMKELKEKIAVLEMKLYSDYINDIDEKIYKLSNQKDKSISDEKDIRKLKSNKRYFQMKIERLQRFSNRYTPKKLDSIFMSQNIKPYNLEQ